jgi:hypothetical protein
VIEIEARRLADKVRSLYKVPAQARISKASLRYIEVTGNDPTVPAAVRDVLAWVVRFRHEIRWTDLAIDDRTGDLVRVERSR